MKRIFIALGLVAALAGAHAQTGGERSAANDERASRKAELDFYMTSFDGGDAKFDCVRPSIPPISRSNAEIVKVDGEVQAWFTCYNAFTQRINDALPPGKKIPESVARLMRPEEIARAREHMNQVYGAIGDAAQATATALVAEHAAWRASTVLFATTKNEETKNKLAADLLAYEFMMKAQREFSERNNGKLISAPMGSK